MFFKIGGSGSLYGTISLSEASIIPGSVEFLGGVYKDDGDGKIVDNKGNVVLCINYTTGVICDNREEGK